MNKIAYDSKLLGSIRLDLGCGDEKHQRADMNTHMDAVDFGQQIVWDIYDGIPLPDNSCEQVYASHFFEHVDWGLPTLKMFNECWRVLKPGGELWVVVPSIHKPNVRIPIHVSHYDEHSFRFFEGDETKDTSWDTTRRSYNDVRLWKITELVTNNRGDIHCRMIPKEK